MNRPGSTRPTHLPTRIGLLLLFAVMSVWFAIMTTAVWLGKTASPPPAPLADGLATACLAVIFFYGAVRVFRRVRVLAGFALLCCVPVTVAAWLLGSQLYWVGAGFVVVPVIFDVAAMLLGPRLFEPPEGTPTACGLPVIRRFVADPYRVVGEEQATLRWAVAGAERLMLYELDAKGEPRKTLADHLPPEGEFVVTPAGGRAYRLHATSAHGVTDERVAVVIQG